MSKPWVAEVDMEGLSWVSEPREFVSLHSRFDNQICSDLIVRTTDRHLIVIPVRVSLVMFLVLQHLKNETVVRDHEYACSVR